MSNRIRAKQKTYYIESTKTTRTIWHPQIKIDGKWCYLKDESGLNGISGHHYEANALEKAIQAFRKMEQG